MLTSLKMDGRQINLKANIGIVLKKQRQDGKCKWGDKCETRGEGG